MSEQNAIDQGNREFWQHVCGTRAAKLQGYDGDDAASIANFDKWFFDYYPYLDQFIPFDRLAGKDVLEIGLGYGSVSQRLARAGARLTGLDIASAPVHWLHHRLASNSLTGKGVQGTTRDMPFEDQSFY
jgi:2-polyprenyl-3-methyl-5-hydroxy-6-metoxy-1,4-benzoquinol methylase